MTLAELARKIPMSPSNLSRLELGTQRPPPDEVIERIANALEVKPDELLAAAGRPTTDQSFEDSVLRKLDAIGQDVQEVKRALRNRK